MTYVYIVLGAVAGAPLRYFLQDRFARWSIVANFPLGTMVVNITGCLAIGLMTGLSERYGVVSRETRLLIVVGFLGAYTTFSTFGLETVNLLRDGDFLSAWWNMAVSVTVGLLAVWAGIGAARLGSG